MAAERGFTLIELLIVVSIIGFLMAAILIAVDPVKRIQDSRDARRNAEANAILHAILTKQVDDNRVLSGLGSAPIITSGQYAQVIVTDVTGINCTATTTRPGCDIEMDTSSATACIAKIDGRMEGTVSSLGVNVSGTGTDFLDEVDPGDQLRDEQGVLCTVATVTSSTSLTCTSAPSPVYSSDTLTNWSQGIVPNWIAEIPIDPRGQGEVPCRQGSGCTVEGAMALGTANSGYYIQRTVGDRIEVGACLPERASSIRIKR